MADILLFDRLFSARFQDRFVPAEDGRILILSRDRRQGSWFTGQEAGNILDHVAGEVEPTRRLVKRSLWLNIPFAIALLAIVANTGLTRRIDELGQAASLASILLIMAGLPLATIFLHHRAIRRTMAEVESQLATRLWVPVPPLAARRGLDRIEAALLLMVAVNLIASLICWIDPDALNNTPLTRSTLSPITLIVLLALFVRRLTGRSARRLRPEYDASAAPSRRARTILRAGE